MQPEPDPVIMEIVEAYRRNLSELGADSNELYRLTKKGAPAVKQGVPLHLFLDHAARAAGIVNSLKVHIEEMNEDAEKAKSRKNAVHPNTVHLLTFLPPLLDRAKVIRNRAVEASIQAYREERSRKGANR